MSERKPIAVVFIHGVGVQDRYQQLSAFSAGITEFSDRKVTEPNSDGPLGTYQVLSVEEADGQSQEIRIYEVFWGPLLNGLTTPISVIRWAALVLWRAFPANKNSAAGIPRTGRQVTSLGKWLWQAGYLAGAIALVVGLLFYLGSATLLAADRLTALHGDPSKSGLVRQGDVGSVQFRSEPDLPDLAPGSSPPIGVEALTYVSKRGDLAVSTESLKRALSDLHLGRMLWTIAYAIAWFYVMRQGLRLLGLLPKLADSSARARLLSTLYGLAFAGGLAWLFGLRSDTLVGQLLIVGSLFMVAYKGVKFGLSEILGDVEIYTVRNENNRKYKGREEVLQRAVGTIQKILKSDDHDEVVIVGHSLGSVIGLEALRRLFTDYSFDQGVPYAKIKSFITIGSPLEKTQLLFDVKDHRSRYQEFSRLVDDRMFAAGASSDDYRFPWFNFWYWSDIVADPLSSYPLRPEDDIYLGRGRLTWSHSDYWRDRRFVNAFWDVVLHRAITSY